MSNEEIMSKIEALRIEITEKEGDIENLFSQLKANYPIQPGDKVRVTTAGSKTWGRSEKAEEGQCTELEIHYDNTIRAICYPFKKDGTVAKTGKIWISHDTKIEKI